VAESCPLFEVANGQFDHGVAAMILVQLDDRAGGAGAVADQPVVA
jgi:hypothetical protein